MPGYTKEQLEAKGAKLAHYILCDNCQLFWHRRAFKKHLNVGRETHRTIAVINPRHAQFLDFIAKAAVDAYMQDVATGKVVLGDNEKPPTSVVGDETTEILTVDEAVEQHGFARDELMARFDVWVPFEATIPVGPRRARKRR